MIGRLAVALLGAGIMAASPLPAAAPAGSAAVPAGGVRTEPLVASDVARVIAASIGDRCARLSGGAAGHQLTELDGTGRRRHLVLIRIPFPSAAQAATCWRAIDNPRGYLSGTVILSRYVSVPRGRAILLYYTETSGDRRLGRYLDAIAAGRR